MRRQLRDPCATLYSRSSRGCACLEIAERLTTDAASGVLTIDLAALAAHYRALQTRLSPARAAGVVKADAYGLGAARVVPALFEAGCRDFFVAHLGEALRLRSVLATDARLFVLSGLQPGMEAPCADAGIVPVLNSLEQVANWSALARARGVELPAPRLQFDTGMSRFGLGPDEAGATRRRSLAAGGRAPVLPDEPSRLRRRAATTRRTPISSRPSIAWPRPSPVRSSSFANSGGVFLGADYLGALARPGIALYGGAPTAGRRQSDGAGGRGLEVPVIQTRTIPAGARVGYGGTHVAAARDAPRHPRRRLCRRPAPPSQRPAAPRSSVTTRLPIVGRVSMDSISIDVTALEAGHARGSAAWSRSSARIRRSRTLREAAGTISYEILTRLGQRYHRIYR